MNAAICPLRDRAGIWLGELAGTPSALLLTRTVAPRTRSRAKMLKNAPVPGGLWLAGSTAVKFVAPDWKTTRDASPAKRERLL